MASRSTTTSRTTTRSSTPRSSLPHSTRRRTRPRRRIARFSTRSTRRRPEGVILGVRRRRWACKIRRRLSRLEFRAVRRDALARLGVVSNHLVQPRVDDPHVAVRSEGQPVGHVVFAPNDRVIFPDVKHTRATVFSGMGASRVTRRNAPPSKLSAVQIRLRGGTPTRGVRPVRTPRQPLVRKARAIPRRAPGAGTSTRKVSDGFGAAFLAPPSGACCTANLDEPDPALPVHDKNAGSSACTIRYRLHISSPWPHPARVVVVRFRVSNEHVARSLSPGRIVTRVSSRSKSCGSCGSRPISRVGGLRRSRWRSRWRRFRKRGSPPRGHALEVYLASEGVGVDAKRERL